jgi:hypothetical protein
VSNPSAEELPTSTDVRPFTFASGFDGAPLVAGMLASTSPRPVHQKTTVSPREAGPLISTIILEKRLRAYRHLSVHWAFDERARFDR